MTARVYWLLPCSPVVIAGFEPAKLLKYLLQIVCMGLLAPSLCPLGYATYRTPSGDSWVRTSEALQYFKLAQRAFGPLPLSSWIYHLPRSPYINTYQSLHIPSPWSIVLNIFRAPHVNLVSATFYHRLHLLLLRSKSPRPAFPIRVSNPVLPCERGVS